MLLKLFFGIFIRKSFAVSSKFANFAAANILYIKFV